MRIGMVLAIAGAGLALAGPADAQEKYLGEIMMTGANFCPRGTLSADGQLLPIAQHTALFSLYGTMYGGDGRTTFALPDLRGRSAVSAGQGPGLADRRQGDADQTELSQPAESPLPVPSPPTLTMPDAAEAVGRSVGRPGNSAPGGNGTTQSTDETATVIVDATLAIRFCVVSEGIYPSRS